MSTVLIHPPFDGVPSGGHTYNRHLLQQAQTNGYPLRSLPCSVDQAIDSDAQRIHVAPDEWVLVDSLLAFETRCLANLPGSVTPGLLLHYLPSTNPQLDAASRDELRRCEDRVIGTMRTVIATGRNMQALLQKRYRDTLVGLCEPGVSSVFAPPVTVDRKPNNEINLLTVANYTPAKGYEHLLKILARLQDRNWHWYWVGEDLTYPRHSEALLTTAQRFGIAQRIHRPRVPDQAALADLMKTMDIFIAASQYESYGMALAESLASGLAAVTTQVGEAVRMIEQGRNGFYVPVGDYDTFTRYLQQLLENPQQLQAFKAAARATQARTWAQTLDDFASACAQVGVSVGLVS